MNIATNDYWEPSSIWRTTEKECLLTDGVIRSYDACSDMGDLEEIKKFYHAFDYIGFGEIYSIDGVRQTGFKNHHFFIKKQI